MSIEIRASDSGIVIRDGERKLELSATEAISLALRLVPIAAGMISPDELASHERKLVQAWFKAGAGVYDKEPVPEPEPPKPARIPCR